MNFNEVDLTWLVYIGDIIILDYIEVIDYEAVGGVVDSAERSEVESA